MKHQVDTFYILDNNLLWDVSFSNIFLPVCGLDTFFDRVFCKEVLNFNGIKHITYFFHRSSFTLYLKKSSPYPWSSGFSSMLSSRGFRVLQLCLWSILRMGLKIVVASVCVPRRGPCSYLFGSVSKISKWLSPRHHSNYCLWLWSQSVWDLVFTL